MGLFSKKQEVNFNQFIVDLIVYLFDFLENNFDKLINYEGKSEVLTEKEKEELLDKAHELMIVNIMMGCSRHFTNLSFGEIARIMGMVYGQFLTEHKGISEAMAEMKIQKVMELCDLIDKAEEGEQKRIENHEKIGYTSYPKIMKDDDKLKFYLCKAFSNYYAGGDMKSENWKTKRIKSFSLANAFIQSDVVGKALNRFSVISSNS